ncbi:hypothetical protein HU200_007362 [Digitaria exilis]|uniref:Legume lectin domain-containing protein n=1 Tax=Digitaria exilis TaxID=1010633 RepID=A0A835KSP2_9POAL|nr:hypothetical protein HU200_007362 [Digitaria exilis]
MNDINGNHVGVDVNSLVSNLSEPAAYYAGDDDDNPNKLAPVTLESAQPIQAWIDYDGGILNVTVAPVSVPADGRPRRPLISTKLDLRPIFKDKQDMYYVGFSSSTGKLASSHYILAWSFRTNGPAQSINLRRRRPWPAVPARGVGARGGAPRRQGQQRAPRRRHGRKARRLRPGAATRARGHPGDDARGSATSSCPLSP